MRSASLSAAPSVQELKLFVETELSQPLSLDFAGQIAESTTAIDGLAEKCRNQYASDTPRDRQARGQVDEIANSALRTIDVRKQALSEISAYPAVYISNILAQQAKFEKDMKRLFKLASAFAIAFGIYQLLVAAALYLSVTR